MDETKFWPNVKVGAVDECWPWQRFCCPKGYGLWRLGGKTIRSHRAAWIFTNGPIPDGLTINHKCYNTSCANPAHLELMTRSQNSSDNWHARKTHCPQGHEYTPENTYMPPGDRVNRRCRTCHREHARAAIPKRREYMRQYHAERYVPVPRQPKTHCPQGHEYTPENRMTDSRGHLRCKQCNRDRATANYLKKKAAR